MYVGFEHTKALINDGFYTFAQVRQKSGRHKNLLVAAPNKEESPNEFLHRFLPIIPKVILCSDEI